jgi:hypothetical protein
MEASRIAEQLAEGDASQRAQAFEALEEVSRSAPSSRAAQEEAVALVVASIRPMIASVLMAPASRIGQDEWTAAALLLYTMIAKVNGGRSMRVAMAAALREDENGFPLYLNTWTSQTNVLAVILAKEPSEW